MGCPNCGVENRPEAKFCHACGTPLELICPNGHPVAAGFRFCDVCGTQVAQRPLPVTIPEDTPSAGEVTTAERRLVSVLFADLVSFTTLSESRDAEEVRELLTRYFDTSRRIISRYGGTIEKFIGDAVMAVWGTPVAQEDDAERAVRAALDLVHAVSALGQEVGAPKLQARAGVLTGKAVVNLSAHGQGMVAGDLVNTASRIQSIAPPGAVYVGEATKRATEAAVIYEDPSNHSVKGKTELVRLWRAARVVSLRGGVLRPTGLEPPFVGRDRELRLIKELLDSSAEEKRAHLLSVVGVAGIGKSRLSWELFKYVDGLAETVWWHRGRCLPYGEGASYGALAEMVKMRAGIIEDEEITSARAKLRTSVEEYIPDAEERKYVEPRLAHLLGLEESGARDRESLFSAWRILFERMAERAPTLLIFEDVQWADAEMLDFIEYLLDWSRSHALLLVTLARPELSDKRPEWGAGRRSVTSLYLEPLAPHAMEELLSGLIPGLPADMRGRILERAEGVPLYAVETVRMLIDRGLLVPEGNAYRPTGRVETLEVPETLHALIAARLDGLSSQERRLVQEGSVLGKTFTLPALVYQSGRSESELESLLASLVRKEVLSLQADPRSPERGQYGFLQELLRRVAYETLSKRERKAKKVAAATFLESGWIGDEDEVVEVVAAHYLEAYQEFPDAPDAEDIRCKARDMLIRAGERAASLAAQSQAERYFAQAAELTDDATTRAGLLERAGQMAYLGGRLDEAQAHYEVAMELFESGNHTYSAARVSARLGDVEYDRGRLVEPVDRMERAFAVLSAEEPDEVLATLAAQLGRLHFFKGETDLSSQRTETALETAERRGYPEVVSQALNTKALVLLANGRQEEALGLLKHSLAVALENDLSTAALRAYVNLGELLFRRDRYEDSLTRYEEGLALARRVGNRVWEVALLSEMIFPLFVLGRWDEAVERGSQIPENEMVLADIMNPLLSLPIIYVSRQDLEGAKRLLSIFSRFESSEDVQESAAHAVARATVHRAEGRLQEAQIASGKAIELARRIGPSSQMLVVGLDEALEAAFARGELAKVEELLMSVSDLQSAEVTPTLRAIETRFQARLSEARELGSRAEDAFKCAVGMFRDIGAVYWMAATLTEYGEFLLRQDRGGEAVPQLEEARTIFEQLRARTWLERAVALPARASSAGSDEWP